MNSDPDPQAAALKALDDYARSMVPVAAIGISVGAYADERLHLHAPLAPNLNDKGSVFGGSMNSLMTFASWGLVMVRLRLAGLEADVYVADSTAAYRKPLYADLHAEAWIAPGQDWDAFLESFRARGRARIALQSVIRLPEGGEAAEFSGRYAAIAKG